MARDMGRWRQAVHEAGHLLLGLRHGRKVIAVTVDPAGQSQVELEYPKRLDAFNDPAEPIRPGDVDLGVEEILIKWGGHAGEFAVFPNVTGDGHDKQEIKDIAQRLGITDCDRLRKQAIAEVVRERSVLLKIAKALEAPNPPTLNALIAIAS